MGRNNRVYYPTGTGNAQLVREPNRKSNNIGGWKNGRATDEFIGEGGEVVDNYGYANKHNDDEYWNDMWITN